MYKKEFFLEIKTLDIRDDGRTENRINRRSFDKTAFAPKSVIIWAGGKNCLKAFELSLL